MIILCRP